MVGEITALPVLERLGIAGVAAPDAGELESRNPATGEVLGRVRLATEQDYERAIERATEVLQRWRMLPAPQRGQIVREIGDELRRHKDDLGALVTLEMGKILAEGRGEVQEMIDIADFAVGLSRQLTGLTMHSERPRHRMYEQWHPLGCDRRDLGIQFSGGGLVLECADRGRVRRLRGLEALAQNSFDRDCGQKICDACPGPARMAGRVQSDHRRGSRGWERC